MAAAKVLRANCRSGVMLHRQRFATGVSKVLTSFSRVADRQDTPLPLRSLRMVFLRRAVVPLHQSRTAHWRELHNRFHAAILAATDEGKFLTSAAGPRLRRGRSSKDVGAAARSVAIWGTANQCRRHGGPPPCGSIQSRRTFNKPRRWRTSNAAPPTHQKAPCSGPCSPAQNPIRYSCTPSPNDFAFETLPCSMRTIAPATLARQIVRLSIILQSSTRK